MAVATIAQNTRLIWDPKLLNTALAAGFRKSAINAKNEALGRSPWPRHTPMRVAFVNDEHAILIGKALSGMTEGGARPHAIVPRGFYAARQSYSKAAGGRVFRKPGKKRGGKAYLAFRGTNGQGNADGMVYAGVVYHPGMKARPFIWPAAQNWVRVGYGTAVRQTMSRYGFTARSK